MKKTVKNLLFVLLAFTFVFSLASCKNCKHAKTQTVAECLIDATETSEGSYDEVVYCLECDEELERFTRTIPKLSCVHIDENEDFSCDKCGEFFIGANHTKHTFDKTIAEEKYLAKEASCTEAALYYKSCGCGEAGRETFAYGWVKHNFEDIVKEELLVSVATCKSPALYYKSCECGEISEETFKKGERLSHVFENEVCTLCSEPFRYVRDGDYVYFGEFPQKIKADSVSITDIPALNGVYIGSDGERYLKVKAAPYLGTGYSFTNGEGIVPGREYYFKIEPIKWRIIFEEGDTVLLHCDTIIANMAFDAGGSNNYFESDLCEWLNGEFLNTAFSEVEKEIIIERISDGGDNVYTELVYTLPEPEAKEYMYDEVNASSMAMQRCTSDYSRATGVYYTNWTDYHRRYGYSEWWSASAVNSSGEPKAFTIGLQGGYLDQVAVTETKVGVAPFVKIELR